MAYKTNKLAMGITQPGLEVPHEPGLDAAGLVAVELGLEPPSSPGPKYIRD